jgi:phenylalanyl-tRNA synthetase beta chain
LIEEIAGSRADEMVIVAGAVPSAPKGVVLRLSRCRSLLGAEVSSEEVHEVLTRLGLAPAAKGENAVEWKIPSYRRDLSREVDLIEEVARFIGMERIGARTAAAPATPGGPMKSTTFKRLSASNSTLSACPRLAPAPLSQKALAGRSTVALAQPVGRGSGLPAHKPRSLVLIAT